MSVKKTKGSKSRPGPKSLEYPKRKPYFANLIVRLMAKSGAAQEITPAGVWLVTVIVNQEDANRYRGPVTYFNGQLAPMIGVATWRRLAKVRALAIEAGWLAYEGEPQGHTPGKYFATIPKDLETPEVISEAEREIGLGGLSIDQNSISNDTPVGTSPDSSNDIPNSTSSDTPHNRSTDSGRSPEGSIDQNSISTDSSSGTSNSTPNGTSTDRGGGGSICQNSISNDTSFYPIPENTNTTPPNPPAGGTSGKSQSGGKSSSGRKATAGPPSATEKAQCERLYQAYPRLSHKGKALEAILKALRGDVATTPELKTKFDVLFEAVNAFRELVLKPPLVDWGRVPHPASWFNARRWEDDRETWRSVGRQGPEYESRMKNFNAGQVQSRSDHGHSNSNNSDRKIEPFPTAKPPSDRGGGNPGKTLPEVEG